MKRDLLTSCNDNPHQVTELLRCINASSVHPSHIILLIYVPITQEQLELFTYKINSVFSSDLAAKVRIISHLNSDHSPGNFHGYDRQYLLHQAVEEYCYMIDADNTFDSMMIEKTIQGRVRCSEHYGTDCVLSPTIIHGPTQAIQSQGISSIPTLYPKMRFATIPKGQERMRVEAMGGNSLFGRKDTLQRQGFDPRLAHVYEDIDFTFGLHRSGVPICVLGDVQIIHQEASKDPLTHFFMGSDQVSYAKGKNRMLFAGNHYSQSERRQYLLVGMPLQTLGMLIRLIRHARPIRLGIERMRALLQGTLDGIREVRG